MAMPMSMPPAGTYPWPQQPQQPGYYPRQSNYYPPQQPYSPPQQGFYPPPQYQTLYPQAPLQFQQPTPYPPGGTPPQSQAWPSHAGEYMGPGVRYNNYRDDDTPDYNNPPEPQYGVPESHRREHEGQHGGHRGNQGNDRSDPRFVLPDNNGQQQQGPNGEGERGLGATVLGGGAGAFLGHKLEHGALGTIGGLAIGAIAANAFEHHEKKKKEERRESRAFNEGYEDGEGHRHSRSRDIDDGDYERDEDRHHSRSRRIEDEYYSEDRYEEDYAPRTHHHRRDYEDDDDYYEEDSYDRRDDYYDRRDDY